VSVGFTLATAAAAALSAPQSVWIATLALAAICFAAAGVQHWRDRLAPDDASTSDLARPPILGVEDRNAHAIGDDRGGVSSEAIAKQATSGRTLKADMRDAQVASQGLGKS